MSCRQMHQAYTCQQDRHHGTRLGRPAGLSMSGKSESTQVAVQLPTRLWCGFLLDIRIPSLSQGQTHQQSSIIRSHQKTSAGRSNMHQTPRNKPVTKQSKQPVFIESIAMSYTGPSLQSPSRKPHPALAGSNVQPNIRNLSAFLRVSTAPFIFFTRPSGSAAAPRSR